MPPADQQTPRVPSHSVSEALRATLARISGAADHAGRKQDTVRLLAVSKKKPASAIREAHHAGQRHFGENYVDEAVVKIRELADLDCCWHFIGAIQSRKTTQIAEHFQWVHSIDREKTARRLSDARATLDAPPLQCCIQINLDNEPQKAGIAPEAAASMCSLLDTLPSMTFRGFMAIPAPRTTRQEQRAVFHELAVLLAQYQQQYPSLDTLSMGMSADLEAAIEEGATIVRVGTAIFGDRH